MDNGVHGVTGLPAPKRVGVGPRIEFDAATTLFQLMGARSIYYKNYFVTGTGSNEAGMNAKEGLYIEHNHFKGMLSSYSLTRLRWLPLDKHSEAKFLVICLSSLELVSCLSPLCNKLFRGIFIRVWTSILVPQSLCPSYSPLVPSSFTDD